MVTNCEFCAFYVYDDDGYAECDVNLDEDEMARFLGSIVSILSILSDG